MIIKRKTLLFISLIGLATLVAQAAPSAAHAATNQELIERCYEEYSSAEEAAERRECIDEVNRGYYTPANSDNAVSSNANGECPQGYIKLSIPIESGKDCIPRGSEADNSDNPIFIYARMIIRFLAGGIGAVITFMIVVGGVQYSVAGDNPQAVEAAKKKIIHAIEALLLLIFMSAILNFIIPGGIL